jgi:hypothetical protein
MAGIRTRLTTIACAGAAAALAASAGARDFASVEGWDISTAGRTCTMASTFADDVTIGLVWSPETRELGFMAAGPGWDELRGKKTVALDLAFDGDTPLAQWEDQRAAVLGGSEKIAAIGNWGAEHADELARAVSSSSRVTVRVGGRAVGSYDLAGSPAAYRTLMRCGAAQAPAK